MPHSSSCHCVQGPGTCRSLSSRSLQAERVGQRIALHMMQAIIVVRLAPVAPVQKCTAHTSAPETRAHQIWSLDGSKTL